MINKITKKLNLPRLAVFAVYIFFMGMVLSSVFRLTLHLLNFKQADRVPFFEFLYAFFSSGLHFDSCVISYVLFIPFLVLTFGNFFPKSEKIFIKISVVLLCVGFVFILSIYSADLPFFAYYNSRLTVGVLSWMDNFGLMLESGFTTWTYYPYVILFVLLSVIICWLIVKLAKKTVLSGNTKPESSLKKNIYAFLILFLLLNGIRGNFNYWAYPIRMSDAFYLDHQFPNQLGLNPAFSFFSSISLQKIDFVDNQTAVNNVRRYLHIEDSLRSPVARKVTFDAEPVRYNVVLFLVESLSADILKRYGYKTNLMPFLDSLMNKSVVFDNVYTAGIHTYNGVYSALTSLPSVLSDRPFASPFAASQKYSGISNTLHQNGYSTVFFCSGDKTFDNMNSFLSNNGFDEIISEENYPENSEKSSYGVYDHIMYEYAVPKLTKMSESGNPFFAVLLTIASHEFLSVPESVSLNYASEKEFEKRYEYTDWALSEFFKKASSEKWFGNTIFIIIGDHGQNFNGTYELPLSYFHSPLIYYSPGFLEPASLKNPGLQIDLFPTLMGILKIPYINNTLGIDLLNDKRRFAYFTSDIKFGCIDNDYFLITGNDAPDKIYSFRNNDVNNLADVKKSLADSMRIYVNSMMQTANFLTKNKLLKN